MAWSNANQGVVSIAIFFLGLSGTAWAVIRKTARRRRSWKRAPRRLLDSLRRSFHLKVIDKRGDSTRRVSLGLFGHALDYLPVVVAHRKGMLSSCFPEQDITIDYFDNLEDIKTSMNAKSVDFLFMSSIPATLLWASNKELCTFEVLSSHSQYLVTSQPNIRRLRDIQGSSIATVQFSSSHFGLLMACVSSGLDLSRLRLIFTSEGIGQKMFRNGEVIVWAIWPLHSDIELVAAGAKKVTGSTVPISSVAIAVNREDRRAQLVAKAIRKAKTWIDDNEGEAKSLVFEEFHAPKEAIESAWREITFSTFLDEEAIADLEMQQSMMLKFGWMDSPVSGLRETFIRLF